MRISSHRGGNHRVTRILLVLVVGVSKPMLFHVVSLVVFEGSFFGTSEVGRGVKQLNFGVFPSGLMIKHDQCLI